MPRLEIVSPNGGGKRHRSKTLGQRFTSMRLSRFFSNPANCTQPPLNRSYPPMGSQAGKALAHLSTFPWRAKVPYRGGAYIGVCVWLFQLPCYWLASKRQDREAESKKKKQPPRCFVKKSSVPHYKKHFRDPNFLISTHM